MKEIKYQQKYVRQLVDMTIDLLRLSGHRKTLIFKAPTGSGNINKEKNVMVRDSEQNASLYEITRRTQEGAGLPIVVVIDEEHLFWSKSADKSAKVLQRINPKVEIRISATPKSNSDHKVTVSREEVVKEEICQQT